MLSFKRTCIGLKNLPLSHGLRLMKKYLFYYPNDQDEIRKYYLQKGYYQLLQHEIE